MRIAVIGAGMAGLACADAVRAAGHEVSVFDKGRGRGGRLATRRGDAGTFDHGAQYATARGPAFRALMERSVAEGHAARWAPDRSDGTRPHEDWYVGVPSMGRLTAPLAEGLDIRTATRVVEISGKPGAWHLTLSEGAGEAGPFERVAVAAPAPQTHALLSPQAALFERLMQVEMQPSWTAMLAFAGEIVGPAYGARRFEDGGTLGWIARDGAKPGRPSGERWVVQASPGWSAAHLEEDRESVLAALVEAFADATEIGTAPDFADAHRWRYAFATKPLSEPCLVDPASGLAACGDWCLAPRVEAAFDSGRACAEALLRPA